ncbi:MAG: DUF4825 domain-containing protein [Ruminococcaceae bacterium]|nr:DUF4825 domain-containing protein [Oscillospiraceae bacterium]
MKKKVVVLVIAAVLCIGAAVAVSAFLWGGGTQYVSIKGYGLTVPATWETTEGDNTLIFNQKGKEVGRFSLLYEDCELNDIPTLFGYEGATPVIRESDQYVSKVYELAFNHEGQDILQYVFDAIPAAPPYKLVLTVPAGRTRTVRRILADVMLPDMGDVLPQKPASMPTGEVLEKATYTILNEYGFFAYNLAQLDAMATPKGRAEGETGFSVLSIEARDGDRQIKTWYHLTTSRDNIYLFTYYQLENGQYIYDNNPSVIKQITKESSVEDDYTRYLADEVLLLETPYNHYAEHKDSLLQYKGTTIGDNTHVHQLVMEALPAGIVLEGLSLETQTQPYGLHLNYVTTKADQYLKDGHLDETVFYQNALVLFALVDNVDWITIHVQVGDSTKQLHYQRQKAEEQMENQDLRDFAENEETFSQFTEDIPKFSPPDETGSGNKTEGTRLICSTTVTVTRDMKIRHPETGQLVSVEPYAKRYGVTQYFDKPITISLYEKVEEGKTIMWASATCNGATIGTYPISSRSEFDALVGMIG